MLTTTLLNHTSSWLNWVDDGLTSLCHSNGHIETMPAREINPFTALTRIGSQFLRTQWSTSNHQRVDSTTPQTAQPSGLANWVNEVGLKEKLEYILTDNIEMSRSGIMVIWLISENCHENTVFHVVRRRSEYSWHSSYFCWSTYIINYLKINKTINNRVLK